MGLKPLEFSDCISDSPWFRQNLREHEVALDEAYKHIKKIETQCRDLINCNKQLSNAQRAFAKALSEFKIETVGTNQTDDERMISTCLKDFAKYINQVEDERFKIINDSESNYLDPIKKFRTEAIGRVINEEKERYRSESRKFYQNLEKHLHLSTVKKSDNDFREADAQLDVQQHTFCKASLQYVTEIQAVQERMKFEFVETLSTFMYSWMSFYHVGHVIHEDFKPFLNNIQERVHNTKESYQATITEAEDLKQRILKTHTRQANSTKTDGGPAPVTNIKQGYIFMLEKARFPKAVSRDLLIRWTKYYCVYSKETRMVTLIPVTSSVKTDMKGTLGQSVYFKLKGCIRRSSDSIDKRFCFDVVSDEKGDSMTFQAMSDEDRRQWLDAMDDKQQVYSSGMRPSCSGITAQLDETGFDFVTSCISVLEERGIREQGLYRNCGVTSKVQKLMQLGLDKRKGSGEKLNVGDEHEWETKTISSAVKTFLRNLPEPLMTFDLHSLFINAAKMDDGRTRVDHIHYYVYQLPTEHKRMLEIIICHLKKVADHCNENLMTVGNLGVCFGPTLLRPKEETMAAIMDIKFCNVVVEVLIANYEQIFNTQPLASLTQPCPPKPDHNRAVVHNEHSVHLPSTTYQSQIRPSIAAEKDNGQLRNSPTPNTASLTVNVKPKPLMTSSPAIRARNMNNMPSSQPTVTSAAATAHIYDAVPLESIAAVATKKLVQLHGSASTSAGTGPGGDARTTTTPPKQAARVRDDSSDSLNSMQSRDSDSPKPAVPEPKAKMSTSYAPLYNPLACETIESKLYKRNSGANLLFGLIDIQRVQSISVSENLNQPARSVPMYSSFMNPVNNLQPSRRVKTLYACTPDHESELCFQPGVIITNVYESKEDGWLVGTLNGKTGLIPSNYVEPLP